MGSQAQNSASSNLSDLCHIALIYLKEKRAQPSAVVKKNVFSRDFLWGRVSYAVLFNLTLCKMNITHPLAVWIKKKDERGFGGKCLTLERIPTLRYTFLSPNAAHNNERFFFDNFPGV